MLIWQWRFNSKDVHITKIAIQDPLTDVHLLKKRLFRAKLFRNSYICCLLEICIETQLWVHFPWRRSQKETNNFNKRLLLCFNLRDLSLSGPPYDKLAPLRTVRQLHRRWQTAFSCWQLLSAVWHTNEAKGSLVLYCIHVLTFSFVCLFSTKEYYTADSTAISAIKQDNRIKQSTLYGKAVRLHLFQGCSSGRQAEQVRGFGAFTPLEKEKSKTKPNRNKTLVTYLGRSVLEIWAWTVMPFCFPQQLC